MTAQIEPGSGLVGPTTGRAEGRAEFPGLTQSLGCLWCNGLEGFDRKAHLVEQSSGLAVLHLELSGPSALHPIVLLLWLSTASTHINTRETSTCSFILNKFKQEAGVRRCRGHWGFINRMHHHQGAQSKRQRPR